jgi:hypothetical protein
MKTYWLAEAGLACLAEGVGVEMAPAASGVSQLRDPAEGGLCRSGRASGQAQTEDMGPARRAGTAAAENKQRNEASVNNPAGQRATGV